MGEERRRREAAEREAADLRKRLRIASDEVRLWREKCELLETDLTELRVPLHLEPRSGQLPLASSGCRPVESGASGQSFADPLYEAELSAIENALDKIYVQRKSLTGGLEQIRQRMQESLDGGRGEVLPEQASIA